MTTDAERAREVRLRMFLEILAAAGGVQDASDTRWNWINAFCSEHEGEEPDTFNWAEQRKFTTVSHNTDTDEGMVYLTDAGRTWLAATPTPSSQTEAQAEAGGLAEAVKPWADFHGDLPDYDHPLRCVFESGVQYAVELLAKDLGVENWDVCDGTEEFDGDLGGTMMNIVCAALPVDADGDHIHPMDVHEALRQRPVALDGDLLDRAEKAWQRFFYPANDCFVGVAADRYISVDLELADCLRLVLAAIGRKVREPSSGISASSIAARDAGDAWGLIASAAGQDAANAVMALLAHPVAVDREVDVSPREVTCMIALEKIAQAVGADWGELGHAENAHLLKEVRTIFEIIGMTDEGDGYGFDWSAAQEAMVGRMGGRSFALIDPSPALSQSGEVDRG